jgi:hypothetical protein
VEGLRAYPNERASAVETAVNLELGVGYQVCQANLESGSDLGGQDKSNVLHAALDTAHVRAINFGLVRESFLGHAD